MERISKHVGENGTSSFSTPLWDPSDVNKSSTIVLHNLGGCPMGKDRDHGVVDSFGHDRIQSTDKLRKIIRFPDI